LKAIDVDAQVISDGDWGLSKFHQNELLLKSSNFDIIHIQYPTAGFGRSLGPQALSFLRSAVVTIHEASQRKLLRKLSLLPFTFWPEYLIFTDEFEQGFVHKWVPWTSRIRSGVIPVGSNIEATNSNTPRNHWEVVHFGLIMPKKGLEEVLELGRLIKESEAPVELTVVGHVPAGYSKYLEKLMAAASGLPISWFHDLNDQQVANRLSRASIAYLPFPDGASDRRTTLKTALQCGLAVLTTNGPHAPSALTEVVRFCSTPKDAFNAVESLIANHAEIKRLSSKSLAYAVQFSWEVIAKRHAQIYEAVLRQRRSLAA
jgi:glycosyltransferase involved in cell wall biosynthesis